MTTKADYTAEEWHVIMQSPMAAGLVVIYADPSNPVGLAQETFAVSKMMAQQAGAPVSNSLISAVAQEIKDSEGRKATQPPKPAKGSDLTAAKAQALGTLQQLNELLAAKAPPEEADGFKQWIVATAKQVAGAAKEGGFLGIGGTPVTPAETAAVADVARTLGVEAA